MEYETLWRNKWLTSDANTIEDMIEMLQGAVDELTEMKDAGITLAEGGTPDDYARLVTEDEAVAKKFGLEVMEWDEEDFDEDDEDDELEVE